MGVKADANSSSNIPTLLRIPKHKLFQSNTDDLEDVLQAQEAEEVDQ